MYQVEILKQGTKNTTDIEYTIKAKDTSELVQILNILSNTGVERFLISVISVG